MAAAPAAAKPPSGPEGLNVIALISGGKDSFFSLLHCRANGHRVIALANLHPALGPPGYSSFAAVSGPALASDVATPAHHLDQSLPKAPRQAQTIRADPDTEPAEDPAPAGPGRSCGGAVGNDTPGLGGEGDDQEQEDDLNSFMYQTVGHQVIPLYAEATGIPLYRRAITGGAGQHGKDYSHYGDSSLSGSGTACEARAADDTEEADETESMVPLLRAIKAAHPEANAICAGAILSTYQRTRVESVATRLGLVPLAFLWKFPVLPATWSEEDPLAPTETQLLDDMAAVGLEARLVKVSSGGLDDSFLWTNVASPAGRDMVQRAMWRFGPAETGAVIGEGGEFETLVLDGPARLFRKRVVVDEADRQVIKEGGGSAWLKLRNARLEEKEKTTDPSDDDNDGEDKVRIPGLLEPRFISVQDALKTAEETAAFLGEGEQAVTLPRLGRLQIGTSEELQQLCFLGDASSRSASVEAETRSIVEQIRQGLRVAALLPSAIVSATILLRRMADFPAINSIYGELFDAPNPPSRVTIACGGLLSPGDVNIAVYLNVHSGLQPGQRQGLHVQSRSYWAPANIGPYSQAISVPVASLAAADANVATDGGLKFVSIAGQIPLIPATMALPAGDNTMRLQLALSLQHLWRIGLDTDVQWWTSAVAYFPSSGVQPDAMPLNARLAGKAWETAHRWSPFEDSLDEDDDEDNDGPDLWESKFNRGAMSLAAGGGYRDISDAPEGSLLPKWSVVDPATRAGKKTPPLFTAEVVELPRGAGVEWHAHLGIAKASDGSITSRTLLQDSLGAGSGRSLVDVHQTIIAQQTPGEAKEIAVVQTVVAERYAPPTSGNSKTGSGEGHGPVVLAALAQLGDVVQGCRPSLVVRYVDVEIYPLEFGATRMSGEDDGRLAPVVPCASLWDARGRRLASVGVYQSVFEKD
ncbi:hypothetical protein B0H63DRAFT_401354 [Podospora didyma]|uniref:Diphthine--ammonia ligase n=1 Tax=Podospora didyma TaxID=330526 RepID=A0AAE0K9F9_9PEZI|nr:hypothetical protein B0H63DRAFT_401354 [Podospora didyma]